MYESSGPHCARDSGIRTFEINTSTMYGQDIMTRHSGLGDRDPETKRAENMLRIGKRDIKEASRRRAMWHR